MWYLQKLAHPNLTADSQKVTTSDIREKHLAQIINYARTSLHNIDQGLDTTKPDFPTPQHIGYHCVCAMRNATRADRGPKRAGVYMSVLLNWK